MKHHTVIFNIFFLLFTHLVFGQQKDSAKVEKPKLEPIDTMNIESPYPSFSLGAGVLIFNGDIGKGNNLSSYSYIRAGYHLNIEKRINPSLGISINTIVGKVARSVRSIVPSENRNFESSIFEIGANAVYHFDNNYILKRRSTLGPFISAGFSYLKFNPYTDLLDKNGNAYNYWTDGSIRDLPEHPQNLFPSNVIKRDNKYETKFEDANDKYSHHTITMPIALGARFQFNDNFEASVAASYHFTFTDYLDNTITNNGNDGFLYSFFSLTYNFPLKLVEDVRYDNVDYENINALDADGDGVKDETDVCLGTPKGVQVDSKGCPLDDDKDGVPDYLDKEANSKKGSVVDANGIAITDQAAAQKLAEMESGATGRNNMEFEFADCDLNHDAYISYDEAKKALDDFFAGNKKITLDKLQRLIQFYLRQ